MRHKIILCFVCIIIMCALCIFIINSKNQNIEHLRTAMQLPLLPIETIRNKKITCYYESVSPGPIELLNEKELHESRKNGGRIFFLETSCSGDGGIVLSARQTCAIESAAKMNPAMNVYLLIVSSGYFSNKTKDLVNQLMTYNNIKIRRIYIEEYVKSTPLEKWWASGVFEKSLWPTEHMADVLRFLTLWKFPGLYLDLDIVITTPLKNLVDFAGAEDSEVVAIGVLMFGASDIGRKIVTDYLEDVRKNFRGDIWRHNGPDILTRILQGICRTKKTLAMTKEECAGFTVFRPSVFYPIYYNNWTEYFTPADRNRTMKTIQEALAIHVWNKLSHDTSIQVGSDAPYAVIASQYCPKIYTNCGDIF